ncbi:ORF6N domain-containing protein [Treponema sp. R80B11-R83G3]
MEQNKKSETKNEITLIQNMIYDIRGHKVMFDNDLAVLYQVETKYLNRTVKRHLKRFPSDFMFQLTDKEWELLRCQFGTAKKVEKMRFNPYVFTEQGIAMLSGLLNSDIAINVNIQIMRVFVQLRHYVVTKEDTNEQIAELRKLLMLYIEKNDKRVNDIIIALNNLLEHPKPSKRIGFNADD